MFQPNRGSSSVVGDLRYKAGDLYTQRTRLTDEDPESLCVSVCVYVCVCVCVCGVCECTYDNYRFNYTCTQSFYYMHLYPTSHCHETVTFLVVLLQYLDHSDSTCIHAMPI